MSPSILISRYLRHHSLVNQEDPDPDLTRFLENGCGCKRAKGKPCSTLFSRAHNEDYRQQCMALTRDELDLVLLGQIITLLSNDRYKTQVFEKTISQTTVSHAVPSWWMENMWQNISDAAWNWYDSHYYQKGWEHVNTTMLF